MPTTNVLTLPPETNTGNHPTAVPGSSSPSTPLTRSYMLILSAAEHRVDDSMPLRAMRAVIPRRASTLRQDR